MDKHNIKTLILGLVIVTFVGIYSDIYTSSYGTGKFFVVPVKSYSCNYNDLKEHNIASRAMPAENKFVRVGDKIKIVYFIKEIYLNDEWDDSGTPVDITVWDPYDKQIKSNQFKANKQNQCIETILAPNKPGIWTAKFSFLDSKEGAVTLCFRVKDDKNRRFEQKRLDKGIGQIIEDRGKIDISYKGHFEYLKIVCEDNEDKKIYVPINDIDEKLKRHGIPVMFKAKVMKKAQKSSSLMIKIIDIKRLY